MTFQPDIIVIGAGMAGSSIAAHLAAHRNVHLFDMEDSVGYHSTGRSAAVFSEAYGNDLIRALTRASRDFFYAPPAGFANAPLVTARRILLIAHHGQEEAFDSFVQMAQGEGRIERQRIEEALALCPILRAENLAGAALSNSPADIDVNELQQGYLRLFRQRGGVTTTGTRIVGLEHTARGWRVTTTESEFYAETIVNAAGGWAGEIARLAGAAEINLQPLKRTACLIDPPSDCDIAAWPMLMNVEEEFYLKPDAGMLLLSPADEIPTDPCDAQPDEIDIAIAVDRLEQATTLTVQRIASKWAGLRSFVPDRSPVVGFDPRQPGFFWMAALGGYGIQTAPALSEISAALLLQDTARCIPRLSEIDVARMRPDRFDAAT